MKKVLLIFVILFIFTGCTNKNSDLSCTYTDSYNVTYTHGYSFRNGVVAVLIEKRKVPKSELDNLDSLKNTIEGMKNDMPGCEGYFKEDDEFYVIEYTCDLDIMSEEDCKKVFGQSNDSYRVTRKEALEFWNKFEPGICE